MKRAAFVLGSVLLGLLAMHVSPPPEYAPDETASPSQGRTPQLKPLIRFRWPGTFHRVLTPGATFSARPT